MALRVTTELVKFKNLQADLDLRMYEAIGLLEGLWHFTAKNAIRGDIGKHSNKDIANWLGWRGDPDKLIGTLIDCKWIDVHPVYRLIIHDWHKHADKSVKTTMRNKGWIFVQEDKLTEIPKRFNPCAPGGQESTLESQSGYLSALSGAGAGAGAGAGPGERGVGEKPISLEEKAADLATEFHFHFQGRKPVLDDLRSGFREKLRHYGEDKFDTIIEAIRGERDKTQYFLGFWMWLEKSRPSIAAPIVKPFVITKPKELLKFEADLERIRKQEAMKNAS